MYSCVGKECNALVQNLQQKKYTLTCFMGARIITELQHVKLSTLRAPADAVDAGDVRTLALDRK